MKKLIIILLCSTILYGCTVDALTNEEQFIPTADKHFTVSKIEYINTEENEESADIDSSVSMRGIWVSQFDMHPIFRDGNKQRAVEEYIALTEIMINNLIRDGFNTIFLQVRPNGDSMYESEYFPMSKYISGAYGGFVEYDAIKIFLEISRKHNISVHAWINPFRLCYEQELKDYGKGKIFNWYSEGIGKRIEIGDNGLLYLDPSYSEATELITNGAEEILLKYDFDGIHLDDYFYPTEFEFDDEAEFVSSGFDSKSDFRRKNIDRTVKALYDICHKQGKIFGIAPAGNIYSLSEGWYVDIYKWCSEDGFIDYVMPQLYFGFQNKTCPFDKILKDWENAVTNKNIKLYIGLSAAKCVLGSQGMEDTYAGENGKFEWRDNKDILKKSLLEIQKRENASGFCIFTYSSFYDPLTGNDNLLAIEEKNAFCKVLKAN